MNFSTFNFLSPKAQRPSVLLSTLFTSFMNFAMFGIAQASLALLLLIAKFQLVVYVAASPCVDGGVLLLGGCEFFGFPVGELLTFADFFVEDDGIDFL